MDAAQRDAVIRRVMAGERDAYRLLVEDLEREVRGFVAAHASSLELVDEVVQAAFVEAYRQLHTYDLRGTFASWVKGFARNLLRRELSQRARLMVQRRFVEQVPINRIAQQFKQTRAAVANALSRIRAALRDCVAAGAQARAADLDAT